MKKCPSCGSARFTEAVSGAQKGDKRCQRCGFLNKKLAHIDDSEGFRACQ